MRKIRKKEHVLRTLIDTKESIYERFGVIDMAVFGSYVRDEQHKHSDIDIFVELKPEHKTFDNYMELKFFLSKIIGGKVDLVLKESIKEAFKSSIVNYPAHRAGHQNH